MSWLVTGGAGFIGSHLVEALTRRGEKVRVIDSLVTGRLSNIEPFMDRIEFIQGDLAEPDQAARAVAGVEFVLHQAALPSVPRSVADPLGCHRNCATATLCLLEAARTAGVRRVVLASSSSVYGDQPELPKRETQTPAPRSPYAAAKLACEGYAAAYSSLHGLSAVCLRYFNVFGPRQNPKNQYAAVVPAWITAVLDGQRPTVYGDGRQSRDFTYVANVVAANLLAAEAPGAIASDPINVACGSSHSLLELLEAICRATGLAVEPVFASPRPGDVRDSLADIGRARKLLGYEPAVAFEQGVALTVRSIVEDRKRR